MSYLHALSSLPILADIPATDVEGLVRNIDFLDVGNLLTAAVIITVAVVLSRVLTVTLDRLGEGEARRRLFFKKILSFSKLGIFALAVYMIAATFIDFEEDQAALIGLSGTIAVAVGFSLKDTASSIMAGIFILFDQPFQVGDRIQFREHYGEVTDIGLRAVRVFTLGHDEVSIPNNLFLSEAVASSNSGALEKQVTFEFFIAMDADFDLAKQIVYEACVTSKYVYLDEPLILRVEDKVTSLAFATMVRCRAYVIDIRYEVKFTSDVMQRVKRQFREHGIDYPYTRRSNILEPNWDELEPSREPAENIGH